MQRQFTIALAALSLAQPALAADKARTPSQPVKAERLAGYNDRVLTYVLIAALIGAIVIATADDGNSGNSNNPASP